MSSTSSLYTIMTDVWDTANHALKTVLSYVHTHQSAGQGGTLDHGLALTGLTDDDHTQYRLESADHTHASSGMQAGQLDHYNSMASSSLLDDDHTQYALRTIMTADGDMIYRASGAWVALPKGTASQTLKMNAGATAPGWVTVPANVAAGTYSGDSTANRAIPHGLGVTPKLIIVNGTNVDYIIHFIYQTGNIYSSSAGTHTTFTVTIPDATNFYVGNAADYTQSANSNASSRTYAWTAMG